MESEMSLEWICPKQPERTNPEDACIKIYYRSDDGVYEKLEPCICDVPNSTNK